MEDIERQRRFASSTVDELFGPDLYKALQELSLEFRRQGLRIKTTGRVDTNETKAAGCVVPRSCLCFGSIFLTVSARKP